MDVSATGGTQGSPFFQSLMQNTRLQLIMGLVGAILLGLGITLTILNTHQIMGILGGVSISLSTPFLGYALIGLVMKLAKSCLNKNSNASVQALRPHSDVKSPQKAPKTKITPIAQSLEGYEAPKSVKREFTFMQTMKHYFARKFESATVISLDVKANEFLRRNILESEDSLKGKDVEGKEFFIMRNGRSLWIFSEVEPGKIVHYVLDAEGKTSLGEEISEKDLQSMGRLHK